MNLHEEETRPATVTVNQLTLQPQSGFIMKSLETRESGLRRIRGETVVLSASDRVSTPRLVVGEGVSVNPDHSCQLIDILSLVTVHRVLYSSLDSNTLGNLGK